MSGGEVNFFSCKELCSTNPLGRSRDNAGPPRAASSRCTPFRTAGPAKQPGSPNVYLLTYKLGGMLGLMKMGQVGKRGHCWQSRIVTPSETRLRSPPPVRGHVCV